LARKAGFVIGSEAVSQMYLIGLGKQIQEKLLDRPNIDSYEDIKEAAIDIVKKRQLLDVLSPDR
jgi:hypothetical protein